MTKYPIDEVFNSLTGFDEIAIEKFFGLYDFTEAETRATKFSRALVFVLERRAGKTDADAYAAVMNMPMSEVQNKFEAADADPADAMGAGPVTESGKEPQQLPTAPTG